MGWFFIIVLVFVVAAVVHNDIDVPKMRELKSAQEKSEAEYIRDNRIIITAKYEYANECYSNNMGWANSISYKFIVDGRNKKVHILCKDGERIAIPFSEIIGCEIFSDNKIVGGIKRAIVGGILAGDTGALVGAITAQQHIMSYKIVIYRSNIQHPVTNILLIEGKVSTNSKDYTSVIEFSQKVLASINAIVHTK